ncbi:MAG: pyridoxal phosphate-dependent aminotransferase [Candidatus Altiarchaeales archaeon]|nr:pyridoxal phosphate-dependent aminotransferase [Candidatus Altiarchaeota archaeon]MBU4341900.1 pyridoxal phosphate-dependent aminotransferase [Candidatus Altiarchaeota archaeon]MCG2782946.1 pyridoxal phosphate-dependent aminotransferase [Candidatus Altiarchaeales archaeon]
MDLKFASRMLNVKPSATFKYNALAKKPGVINLTIGRPDFDTPQVIKNAAKKALDGGKVHYTPTKGIPELREQIANKLVSENGINGLDADDVILSGGGKQILYEALQALIGPGDTVALQNPCWVSYEPMAYLAGGEVDWFPLKPEKGFIPGTEYMNRFEKTSAKVLILNSPSNPTGAVISKKLIREIMDICLRKNIFVISDEVYERFVYDGKFYSPARDYENVLTVNAFSKTYSMTGWRLGYAACYNRELVDKMNLIQGQSLSCCTSFAQYGALTAFTNEARKESDRMVSEFKRRRDYVMERIRELDCVCVKPSGAFYVFPYFGVDDLAFSEKLLEAGVGVVPGSPFGSCGKGCVRISYGSANVELLSQAFDRIEDAM